MPGPKYELEDVLATLIPADQIDSTSKPQCLGTGKIYLTSPFVKYTGLISSYSKNSYKSCSKIKQQSLNLILRPHRRPSWWHHPLCLSAIVRTRHQPSPLKQAHLLRKANLH
jgi:hypothetical protein